jgi:hypothetical protein
MIIKVGIDNSIAALKQMQKTFDKYTYKVDDGTMILRDITHYVSNDIIIFTIIEEWKNLELFGVAFVDPYLAEHIKIMNCLSAVPIEIKILKGPASLQLAPPPFPQK